MVLFPFQLFHVTPQGSGPLSPTLDRPLVTRPHFLSDRTPARVPCAGCGTALAPAEVVRRARHLAFHPACFSCSVCDVILRDGELFYVTEGNTIVCEADFEQVKFRGK